MKEIKRQKMVLAMEYIARMVNDEDVFESWLMCGVADGDIKLGSLDPEEVDAYYLEDDNFKYLMTLFLRLMVGAWKSGGLYCDEIVSSDREDFKS